MVTAAGSMGSKSKQTRLRSVQPLFFLLTRKSKMENAPDIKSKSFEKMLKYRLVCFDEICHIHRMHSAINAPIHIIKCQILFYQKLNFQYCLHLLFFIFKWINESTL
jgi:hypothetical protein